ncbi:hypothetical protein [Alteraurantiacibacter aquimixticola]|uniref:Uncharacterized protein n=1 Tax=Alteraurantiacibacter aquimixticola TaxID=2489173 RepID=A0A4T3EWF0_9SPHN|nr:hypothetical protein [Alteraurantiacibacter aquimixticola]TIX48875.1 hypothetical protein E5222_14125 [Alteraurantiacibacter aquimixticola]
MDLLAIFDSAVAPLPEGPFTPGLKAIRRHIVAAIRHFEREDDGEQDSFTDAIYRCNQAYEGGLKEAYRVLADEDPARLTPHQIESYLEEKKLLRPRVLKQLTRYREDYRNPSTHDYRLDFDEDEAILAIVAVCAFARTLINQISGKLAYNAGAAILSEGLLKSFKSEEDMAEEVASLISRSMLQAPSYLDGVIDFDLFIDGVLNSNGFATKPRFPFDEHFDEDDLPWSNAALHGGKCVPVEVRILPLASLSTSLAWLREKMPERNVRDVVMFVGGRKKSESYETRTNEILKGYRIHLVFPAQHSPSDIGEEEIDIYNSLVQERGA